MTPLRPFDFAQGYAGQASSKKAYVLGLSGDLGSGKTTFVQGFAKGLGIKQRIVSPTFILMRTYEIPKGKYKHFYHIDLYRLEGDLESELVNLGLPEVLSDSTNIVLVEWVEKAKDFFKSHQLIKFETISEEERKIFVQ